MFWPAVGGTFGLGMFGGPTVDMIILDGPVFVELVGGGRFPARR
jgi:hypothetical protein